jgi:hypothetical protein
MAPPRAKMPLPPGFEQFAQQMFKGVVKANKDVLVQPTLRDAVLGFYHAVDWTEVRRGEPGGAPPRARRHGRSSDGAPRHADSPATHPPPPPPPSHAALDHVPAQPARGRVDRRRRHAAPAQLPDRALPGHLRRRVRRAVPQRVRRAPLARAGPHAELL